MTYAYDLYTHAQQRHWRCKQAQNTSVRDERTRETERQRERERERERESERASGRGRTDGRTEIDNTNKQNLQTGVEELMLLHTAYFGVAAKAAR